jgi:hypothetical protein
MPSEPSFRSLRDDDRNDSPRPAAAEPSIIQRRSRIADFPHHLIASDPSKKRARESGS